jgi:hypothetical protein
MQNGARRGRYESDPGQPVVARGYASRVGLHRTPDGIMSAAQQGSGINTVIEYPRPERWRIDIGFLGELLNRELPSLVSMQCYRRNA